MLLLVVSETGLVYTFTTVKLQPIVTKPEGKNLIQACLNAPDPNAIETVKRKRTRGSKRVKKRGGGSQKGDFLCKNAVLK